MLVGHESEGVVRQAGIMYNIQVDLGRAKTGMTPRGFQTAKSRCTGVCCGWEEDDNLILFEVLAKHKGLV